MIRAVVLELFGALLDGTDFTSWSALGKQFALDLSPEDLAGAYSRLEADGASRLASDGRDWMRALLDSTGRVVPASNFQDFLTQMRPRVRGAPPFSDARKCLDRLHREGIRMGVVDSDTSPAEAAKLLEDANMTDRIERVVCPPSKVHEGERAALLTLAAEGFRLPRAEILYVSDGQGRVAQAVSVCGMPAVWLNRYGIGDAGSGGEIVSLSELSGAIRAAGDRAGVK
jgi:FMN phosphatase YigB (HAD superfamily)